MAEHLSIQILRGNLAAMPILLAGQPCFALDTHQLFVGDGVFNWPIGAPKISDGNYGDITVASGGTVWSVNNGVITAAKLAAVTGHRLLGRSATSSGTAQEVTIDQALQFYAPAVGDFLAFNGTNFILIHPSRVGDQVQAQTVSGNLIPQFVKKGYIKLSETVPTGTNGGTFTSGAWRLRNLNIEDFDTGGDCTLSSNQFTLVAGTYEIQVSAPAAGVNAHQCRLWNATDSSVEALGSSEYAGSGVGSNSLFNVRVVYTANKTLQVEHQCQTTSLTVGFGVGTTFAPSVFTQVIIHRVA
jgi:hypothetical protein